MWGLLLMCRAACSSFVVHAQEAAHGDRRVVYDRWSQNRRRGPSGVRHRSYLMVNPLVEVRVYHHRSLLRRVSHFDNPIPACQPGEGQVSHPPREEDRRRETW